MRAVVQKVSEARVWVADKAVGEIKGPGLLVLVGATHDDATSDITYLAEKIWRLRILDDERSAEEIDAPILVVSQFTLYADTRKGRRPSWNLAAPRPVSEPLITQFVSTLRRLGARVETGVFGADMQVESVNDGPVTLVLDSATS